MLLHLLNLLTLLFFFRVLQVKLYIFIIRIQFREHGDLQTY
jgi:hypothetical protein